MEAVPKAVLGALAKPRRPVIACSVCQIRFNSEGSSPPPPPPPAPPGPPRPPPLPRRRARRRGGRGGRGGGAGGGGGAEEEEEEEEEERAKAKRLLYCGLCKVAVNSLSQLEAHNKGTKHKTLVEARSGLGPIRAFPRGGGSGTPPAETPERSFHCQICNVRLNSELQLKQAPLPFPKELPKALGGGLLPPPLALAAAAAAMAAPPLALRPPGPPLLPGPPLAPALLRPAPGPLRPAHAPLLFSPY
ncbi:hypothetical protein DUI87_33193 [Hirundo rustica rustica]|uniref:C2H2-type domain-containing protein n=1 Tax=Hirundo rustica rustica TaxID=333673 RepID=A0A3M0IPL1_HIRRU|nr:hypothetical protein DUI87_33193 [Hirundo rustica rustica]